MQENDKLYELLPRRVKTANIVLLKTISIGALMGGFTCIVAIAAIGNPISNRNKSIASLSLASGSLLCGFVALACSKACDEADRYHDYLEQQEQRSILRRFGADEHLDRATLAAYLLHEQAKIEVPQPLPPTPNNPPKLPKPNSSPPVGQPIPQTAPLPSTPAQVLESQLDLPVHPQDVAKMPGIHPTTNVTLRDRLADVLSPKLEKVPLNGQGSKKQPSTPPLGEDEIIAKALKQKRFSSVKELIILLESPRYYWLRIVCLSRLFMIIGDQGSGKTSFSKFVCGVRQLLWKHKIAIHDPHAEKNGWPENWTVKGHHKNYGDIDQGIDDYFDAVDQTNGSGQRLTFLFDEVTQYKDSLPDGDKAQKFVKSWCSDVRKSDLCLIVLTHSDTNEGLAGTKGMKASIESSFLRLFLGNQIDPQTGDFKPNFKGVLIGLNRDEFNNPQQTVIKIEQWMQISFITDLLFPKSPTKVASAPTIPAAPLPAFLSSEELNIQQWQAAIFPSQLDLIPKNTDGIFAICLDGYNPVYIGLLNGLIASHYGQKKKPFYEGLQSLAQEGHQPYIAFFISKSQTPEFLRGALSQLIAQYNPVWNSPTEKASAALESQPLKLTEQQQAVVAFCQTNNNEISIRQAMRELGTDSDSKSLSCRSSEEALLLFEFLEKLGLGKVHEVKVKGNPSTRFRLTP